MSLKGSDTFVDAEVRCAVFMGGSRCPSTPEGCKLKKPYRLLALSSTMARRNPCLHSDAQTARRLRYLEGKVHQCAHSGTFQGERDIAISNIRGG